MAVPLCQTTQEIRLAVVMYGGVSLAIYINGVAQELLHLVRATAPTDKESHGVPLGLPEWELSGTERVYRKLGQILSRQEGIVKKPGDVKKDSPILTRFVIDIISGTSAGGINGVFLAKALVEGQDTRPLRDLWVTEGDIGVLINDRNSTLKPLGTQIPPQSLLDSRRMYLKLLDAFHGMDVEGERKAAEDQKRGASRPTYTSELDLFVTTTDIRGLSLPIRLADMVVDERRHRNVFHFKQDSRDPSGPRNDFKKGNNPFLAFACRSTSAFPFAFEPMRLSDIDEILAAIPDYNSPQFASSNSGWRDFFPSYRQADGANPIDIANIAFGDGGYLDNKPFSYAIDALLRRQADVPVDRKLFYVEPSPEDLKAEIRPAGLEEKGPRKPNAFENSLAAGLSLPRYETVREDLQRVLDRNRLVDRVRKLLVGSEDDVQAGYKRYGILPGEEWGKLGLGAMIEHYGVTYGGYFRLKVAALTDELTCLINRAAGFDEGSGYFLAVRYLVRAWREDQFSYNPEPGKATYNQFLLDYDVDYRMRRLSFVRGKLDLLSCLDKTATRIMRVAEAEWTERIQAALPELLPPIKSALNRAHGELSLVKRRYWARMDKNPLQPMVLNLQVTKTILDEILEEKDDAGREQVAQQILAKLGRRQQLKNLASELGVRFREATTWAADQCRDALHPEKALGTGPEELAIRRALWHYYAGFEDYDLISYPILRTAELGELDTVEIYRISPQDAPSLINEREEKKKGSKRRKLAGTALGNFGAFLERSWRENDILWGRLDGAERILHAFLPNHPVERQELLEEAQREILKEELRPQVRSDVVEMVAGILKQTTPGSDNEKALREIVKPPMGSRGNPRIESLLKACLNEEELRCFLRDRYQVSHEPNPRSLIEALSRASRVVGGILEHIADQQNIDRSRFAWVTRLSQIFWGLVIVAVPGSLRNLMMRHWLKLLYLFEFLLLVGGVLLVAEEVQQFGWKALGITLGVHATVLLIGDFMRGRPRWQRFGKAGLFLFGGLLLVLAVIWFEFWIPELLDRIIGWLQSLKTKLLQP